MFIYMSIVLFKLVYFYITKHTLDLYNLIYIA